MTFGTDEETDAATLISRRIVSLLREVTGRGAALARTTIAEDHVLVILEGTLTQGERTLVTNGHETVVGDMRAAIYRLVGTQMSGFIESVLDRRVSAVMDASHLESDRAAKLFLLEPLDAR